MGRGKREAAEREPGWEGSGGVVGGGGGLEAAWKTTAE